MDIEQIRKDFEERMVDGGLSQRALERNSNGDYILMQADRAWHVWKAAHAHYAKPTAPVVLPEPQADALDAECFRFWVSEAARSPAAMAKLIMHCTTEDEYRAAIIPCIEARKSAIAAAKENK